MQTEMETECNFWSPVGKFLIIQLLETFFLAFCTFQPSQIKFSCLPVSRVECMLKLPSLDLVFSSNRGELETLGATYPTETLSPGGNAPQSGTKTSASKTGIPGVETILLFNWHKAKYYFNSNIYCQINKFGKGEYLRIRVLVEKNLQQIKVLSVFYYKGMAVGQHFIVGFTYALHAL